MPVFKFLGFVNGTAVSLSATQGGNIESGSIPSWGQSAAISLSVTANRTTGTAPMGVLLSANASSSEPRVVSDFHDIEGVWNFDDPGHFTALGNSPIWGTDRNVAYGPRAVHVFETPGTYNVAFTAMDGTNARTETVTIVVDDPDDVFSGADTAVVSGSSNFAGAPSGASQHTSISSALSALSGRTNQRILLRAGESFTEAVGFEENGGSDRKFFLGRFGTGAKPVLDMSASDDTAVNFEGGTSNIGEAIVDRVQIIGAYDPTASSQPIDRDGAGIKYGGGATAILHTHKTIWSVEMSNIGGTGIDIDGIGRSPGDQSRRLYCGDTRIIGWRNYGLLSGDGGEFGFCGCTIQQPTGTVNGASKSGPQYWPDHGPFRLSRPYGMTVFSNCDMTSFNNWAANSGSQSFQPPIRWNAGEHSDQEMVIDRLRCEGGPMAIYNDTGGGEGITDNFVVIDRVHHIPSDLPGKPLSTPMGGVTFRNYVLVVPNVPPGSNTGVQEIFADNTANNDTVVPGAQTRRSELYSCALIDLRTDANARSRNGNQDRDFKPGGFSDLTDVFFGNNVLFAPNMVTGGEVSQMPLDTAIRWSVLYDGERWEFDPLDSSRAYSDDATAAFRPLAGSSAIGGAIDGKVSLIDFDGNLRSDILSALARSTPSLGPYEPALEN